MNKLIFSAAVAVVLAGCGGGNPVTTYAVNEDKQETVAAGTHAQCSAADPQAEVTTTNIKADATLSVWTEADNTVYAELAGKVYTGKKGSGNSYTLTDSNSTENTTQQNVDSITSDVWTLTFTVNGNFVSGSVTEEQHSSCNGTACNNQPTIDCIYTTNLRGEQLPNDGALAGLPTPSGG